jgi:hypothetical protein
MVTDDWETFRLANLEFEVVGRGAYVVAVPDYTTCHPRRW